MTAQRMVSGARKLAKDRQYEAVSIGYPGPALRDRAVSEPPPGCRAGDNANAFLGGFRMWEDSSGRRIGGRSRESAERLHQTR
jgi:polyphosphate glucokinase